MDGFLKRLTWDDARRQPARPDIAILKDGFKKKKKKSKNWTALHNSQKNKSDYPLVCIKVPI